MTFRTERDPLGELDVPAAAYYGVQTARAVENFPISGLRAPTDLVTATILVKKAAAEANRDLGRLDPDVARAIIAAADDVLGGALRDQFVVDVYQAGAGTSHNMNANEVLANRAAERLGLRARRLRPRPPERSRQHGPVHERRVPDRDTAGAPARKRTAAARGARPGRERSQRRRTPSRTSSRPGRTHLQDAVPITFGQEFGGYASCLRRGADDVAAAGEQLQELNIGATAVGTG